MKAPFSFYAIPICPSTIDNFLIYLSPVFFVRFQQRFIHKLAYSEELSMFTVNHYSPVPFIHACVYILTVTNELILSLWLVQCGILTSMSTQRLRIYSTATIAVSVVVLVGEALLYTMPGLSPERIKGFSAYQSARGRFLPHFV